MKLKKINTLFLTVAVIILTRKLVNEREHAWVIRPNIRETIVRRILLPSL